MTVPYFENGKKVVYMAWLSHGKYHREDGPARIWEGSDFTANAPQYWLNNTQLSKDAYDARLSTVKLDFEF